MSSFKFPENDIEGLETLDSISNARLFNQWMYETIKPFCKGKILEIGSGIGNISQHFIEDDYDIMLSDIRLTYYQLLKERFFPGSNQKSVIRLDIVDERFDEKFADYFNTFDSIFALNVLEHIQDDKQAIRNCRQLLRPNGHLIILVPSYNILYNEFDKALEHYRRYTAQTLTHLLKPEFNILHTQYYNAAGILGWIYGGSLLKRRTIPQKLMKYYDRHVPIFKIIDKMMLNEIGLSVLAIGTK